MAPSLKHYNFTIKNIGQIIGKFWSLFKSFLLGGIFFGFALEIMLALCQKLVLKVYYLIQLYMIQSEIHWNI